MVALLTGSAAFSQIHKMVRSDSAAISHSYNLNPVVVTGSGNKYILILINGQKLNGDISNNVDLNRINMARVKRIEILDGAASSLYGSDAIAGVINIITDQPTQDLVSITSDHRMLLPFSLLSGAVLALLCHLIARMPGFEGALPVNSVTALVGAPVIVSVLFRCRQSED